MHIRSVPCLLVVASLLCGQNPSPFLRQNLKLSDSEIRLIEAGKPVAKELSTPDRSELFLFGVIFVRANPAESLKLVSVIEKLVSGKGFLAEARFSAPPVYSDLNALSLTAEDLVALRDCIPGDCELQLPADMIEEFRTKVRWGTPQSGAQANQLMREFALRELLAYQRNGNPALSIYGDQRNPVYVERTFQTMLDHARQMPYQIPAFTRYLLDYPVNKPDKTSDFFYWEHFKFGLRPTFRVNHGIVYQPSSSPVKWLVASKQIYATHYFQTALDTWFCLQDEGAASRHGFYLVTLKSSRQDGLTGFGGSILRRIALYKSKDALYGELGRLKVRLENPLSH